MSPMFSAIGWPDKIAFVAEQVTVPVPFPTSNGSGPASRSSPFTTAFDATNNATEPRMVVSFAMDNPPLEGFEIFRRLPRVPFAWTATGDPR